MTSFPLNISDPFMPLRASDFMHAVGLGVFGDQWRRDDIESDVKQINATKNGNSENPQDRKIFIQKLILDALSKGTVTAQVNILSAPLREAYYDYWYRKSTNNDFKELLPKHILFGSNEKPRDKLIDELVKLKLPEFVDKPFETRTEDEDLEFSDAIDDVRNALVDFEKSIPKVLNPEISRYFWKRPSTIASIDWPRSTAHVEFENLIFPKSAIRIYDGSKKFDAMLLRDIEVELTKIPQVYNIWIREGQSAVEKTAAEPLYLKSTNWGKEHLERAKIFWPEIVAAIWRILAINPPIKGRGAHKAILEQLRDYLERELGDANVPSDGPLADAISEIYLQWESRQLDAPVLINTGRPWPKPPKK